MSLETYQKLYISLRYYLIGKAEVDKKYLVPLEALEYAKKIHIGKRKDNITPEFQHQIEIAHFVRTLPNLIDPANTLAVAILHDTIEDYDIKIEEIEKRFNSTVSKSVLLLNKKVGGAKLSDDIYYSSMAADPIASIVKGCDRIHNQKTMHPVFTNIKQKDYIRVTEEYLIPMLKKARHLHVAQEAAYENVKFVLKSQIMLTSYRLAECQLKGE